MNRYWTMPLDELRDLIYNIAPVGQCGRLEISIIYLYRVKRMKEIRVKRIGIRDRKLRKKWRKFI